MSGNVVWSGLVPQSALEIQRRDKEQLWAMERASHQKGFSNWSLDALHCFEWGGNAFEDTEMKIRRRAGGAAVFGHKWNIVESDWN